MLLKALCPKNGSPAANEHLKRQIQWLLFLRVVFLSLLLGISILLESDKQSIFLLSHNHVAYFIAGLYLFSIFSAFILGKIHCYNRFGYLQILIDTLLVSALIFFTGGSQSVFTVVYFFPIVMGSFMLFRRGGFLVAALSTIFYALLLWIEYNGSAPRFLDPVFSPLVTSQTALHFFAIHGLTFFLVALLSSMLSERLQKTEAALFKTTSDFDSLSVLYKQIFDDINTGIVTVDDDDTITSFNRAAELITGYTAHDVLGQRINQLFPGLIPMTKENERPVSKLIRKDGEAIPVGYSWARLNSANDAGNDLVFTMQDLSEIKKMEAKVQQAEKMAAIGEMAAGIAHEFRNPLAAISGAAQILERGLVSDPTNRRLMDIINRECDRLADTVQEFLLFSKPAPPEKRWFSLLKLAKESMETLAHTPGWPRNFQVHLDIPSDLDCLADQQLIKQVLLNLIANSSQACKRMDAGQVTVTAHEVDKGKTGRDSLVIEVCDNGPGVKEALQEKIFAPFFTTREDGTGLGLAIVRQIVESHGGDITLTSTGEGACFTITLPLP